MVLFIVDAYPFTKNDDVQNRDAFVDYWINQNMLTKDVATQMYTILKQPDLKYLMQVT